jgi:multiple sugar transport system permease protein
LQRTGVQLVRLVLLLIGSAVFLVPLLWMFSTAIKPLDQTMSMPPRWLPTKTLATVDGERVEVGVGKVPEGAGPDTMIAVTAAYQWTTPREGKQIPLRLIEILDDNSMVVELNYHLEVELAGKRFPVRRVNELDAGPSEGETEVTLIYPDGSMRRRNVDASTIERVIDVTTEAIGKSYSLVEQQTLSAEQVQRRYIPWNDRHEFAYTQTQNLTVPFSGLDERVSARWDNFGGAIREMKHFWTYLGNTLILCLFTVIGTAVSSAVVAYGFSRIDWPGRDKVFLVVLGTMMIPFPVVMVPLYSLFKDLGWIGTLRPLWVPAFFAGAFNVFLLRQFFRTIPRELSEAARIDGCSEFRIFLQVIVPLAKPALTVVALFQFLYTWNDFLGPLIYLTDDKDYTLALALQSFQSQQGGTQWHYLMAASTLVVAPIILLFFLAQRTFIEGVSMSGLKG